MLSGEGARSTCKCSGLTGCGLKGILSILELSGPVKRARFPREASYMRTSCAITKQAKCQVGKVRDLSATMTFYTCLHGALWACIAYYGSLARPSVDCAKLLNFRSGIRRTLMGISGKSISAVHRAESLSTSTPSLHCHIRSYTGVTYS